ncbi:MAG: hypothetical protein JSV78_10475 [Phycisphaerales bacterium]|nr:MAG: hypothetical protein JSV78_10475 [Phycisphaerales bacterium]
MKRTSRVFRWLLVVGAFGVLPTAIMRCDKAALNFQRGFYEGLGENLSDLVSSQVEPAASQE